MSFGCVVQFVFVDVEDENFVAVFQICFDVSNDPSGFCSRYLRHLQPLAMHRPIPLAPPLMSTAFGSVTSLPVPLTPAILESCRRGQNRSSLGFGKPVNHVDKERLKVHTHRRHHDGFMT